jgi:hypothetical protein
MPALRPGTPKLKMEVLAPSKESSRHGEKGVLKWISLESYLSTEPPVLPIGLARGVREFAIPAAWEAER